MKQISAYIGVLFALALFAGVSLGGQHSPVAFFATPVAHAQYDNSGYDTSVYDTSGYDTSGYSSGYDTSGYGSSYGGYDPSAYSGYDNSGYDNSGYTNDYSGYYNVGYDTGTYNTYDPVSYSNDTSGYDYGYCYFNCNGSSYNTGGYTYGGGYTYTPPIYSTPIYTPPVYQTPIYNTPIYTQPPVTYSPVQSPTPTCPAGETYQNGVCSTPTVASCPPGQTFANGVCSTPTVASCPAGQTFQNGVCSSPVIAQPTQPIYPQPIYTPQPIYQQPPVAYNNYLPPPVQPQRPYISLSQVPYTGLDLGPVGTVLYWVFLILWTFAGAYLIGVKKIQNTLIPKLKTFFFGTRTKKAPVQTVTPIPAPVTIAATPSFGDDFILQQINRARA